MKLTLADGFGVFVTCEVKNNGKQGHRGWRLIKKIKKTHCTEGSAALLAEYVFYVILYILYINALNLDGTWDVCMDNQVLYTVSSIFLWLFLCGKLVLDRREAVFRV